MRFASINVAEPVGTTATEHYERPKAIDSITRIATVTATWHNTARTICNTPAYCYSINDAVSSVVNGIFAPPDFNKNCVWYSTFVTCYFRRAS